MFRFQCVTIYIFSKHVISISRSYSLIFLYFDRFIDALSYDRTNTFYSTNISETQIYQFKIIIK